jgi:hypothetical protein
MKINTHGAVLNCNVAPGGHMFIKSGISSKSITNSVLAALLLTASGTSALADNNGIAQLFRCNSRGPLGFRNITSKEKQFDFGGTNRVADLVSIGDGGVSGLDIVLFRTTFNSIQWYFKAASDSNILSQLKVKYCFTVISTGEKVAHIVKAGDNATITPVKDGWSLLVQNNKAFPERVLDGKAVLDRLEFTFDNDIPNSVVLGKVTLNGDAVSTLLFSLQGCIGRASCSEKEPQ